MPDTEQLTSFAMATQNDLYASWISTHRLHHSDIDLYEQRIASWPAPPRFHLVLLDEYGDMDGLVRSMQSIAEQYYSGTRISVVSPLPAPDGVQGNRLDWVSLHSGQTPGESVNHALAGAAEPTWVGVLHAGDLLAPHALLVLAEYLHANPQLQAVYSDEDLIEQDGSRHSPRFKPDFDLEWLRGSAYVGGLLLVRSNIWVVAGGWQQLPGRLGEFDLALRLAEHVSTPAFGHLADVLYHRNAATPTFAPAAELERARLTCLQDHLARQAPGAETHPGLADGTARIIYPLQSTPKVSILIAADERLLHLQRCIESLVSQTDYPDFELILISHATLAADTQAYLQALQQLGDARLIVLNDAPDTSPTARLNFAAQAASGDLLMLLAPSTAAVHRDWLVEMVALLQQADVLAVGARLLTPDGKLQHAGYLLGLDGAAATPYAGQPADEADALARNQVTHRVTALSRDCMLLTRQTFLAAGGFASALFPDQWADVDLCLRLGDKGQRILWTPFATLLNSETQTPATEESLAAAHMALQQHWLPRLTRDPAGNPNLSLYGTALKPEPEAVVSWNPITWNPLPRILVHPVNRDGSGQYRMLIPARALHDAGLGRNYASQRFLTDIEVAKAELSTIVVQHPTAEPHVNALKLYQRCSQALRVVELDDLITHVTPDNPAATYFNQKALQHLDVALQHCDRLVVTTAPLAAALGPRVPQVCVVPNYLPGNIWNNVAPPRKPRKKPRIGWSGSDSHLGDLKLLAQILPVLSREVDWVFFGLIRPEFRPYIKQIFDSVPFDAYPEQLAAMDLDLAIAPLQDTPFNEAKSCLKLLEYGILGYPVVCSGVGPYQDPSFPVQRVDNTPQAWIAAIRERIHDLDAARAEGEALQTHVRQHWMLEDHLEEWRAAWTR